MGIKEDAKNPSTKSQEHALMSGRWQKMSALLGGTEIMRSAGATYLPQHQHEADENWRSRISTAVLFNVTQLTLDTLVGRPFSDQVKANDDVPEDIEALFNDIDLQGNDLHTFARSVFENGFAKGLTHVMVEFPRVREGARTMADDAAEKLRPYWVRIIPENVIYAFAEVINGEEILTHIRISEIVRERVGFTETMVEQIRVLDLVRPESGNNFVTVTLFQEDRSHKDQWNAVEQWDMGITFIPFATFYADRQGFMLSKPPLLDLADLNILHWQSSSDQENIMTVARFPMLAASGVPPKPSQELADATNEDQITIGPFHVLQARDPETRFYYVEHKGAAIESGERSIERLENRMSQYGAEFLKKKPGNPTATARALDSAEATSPLQDTTNRFISFVNTLLDYTAAWMGKDEGGTIQIVTDFGPEELTTQDITALIALRKERDISREGILVEYKRRGILADEFNVDEDADLLEGEIMEGIASLDLDPMQPEPVQE